MGGLCGRALEPEEGEDSRALAGKGKGKGKGKAVPKTGYTVDQFVGENLVPVFGIICRKKHAEKKRKQAKEKEHKAVLMDANQALTSLYQEYLQNQKLAAEKAAGNANPLKRNIFRSPAADSTFAISARAIAAGNAGSDAKNLASEAICNVKLDEARIEENLAYETFDFNQETRLEVKVYGSLIFPPSTVPEYTLFERVAQMEARLKELDGKRRQKGENANNAALPEEEEEIDTDELWSLQVEVKLVLERYQDDGEDKPAESADLRVRCLSLQVEDRLEAHGDPLIDSWLPRDDILQDVELLLDAKVSQAIAGLAEGG